ncbi:conserved protein of unknown function [Georgfuchsia toluolica]|uniref:Uncharacterized protein n=1 Tax=Georgfuchsia toluolica TaxID=424218 RepID=A0A916N2E0_9PROT|nr:hypothetical protein [Georgfuchsia toluolica]CAG4883764.1 conserved protein of unknown function [Georgfuchsia toluolica]
MEMITQGKVTGFKWWKSADKQLDVGTLYLESNLKNSKKDGFGGENGEGFAKGYASAPIKCASAEVVKKIKHLETPFSAEIVIDQETDGAGGVVQVCMDVRPMQRVEPAKKAA